MCVCVCGGGGGGWSGDGRGSQSTSCQDEAGKKELKFRPVTLIKREPNRTERKAQSGLL